MRCWRNRHAECRNEEDMSKKIFDSKWLYCVFICLAVLNVAFVLHICCSYEALIRPILARLIEENKIGNTIDGANWLAYFTVQSNLFVSIWFLLWSIGKLCGADTLVRACQNHTLATCVTLYIFATGLLYTCSTLFGIRWFDKTDGGAIVNNVVNVYHHFIIPPLTLIVYFCMPVSGYKSPKDTAMIAMLYPLAYLAFSLFRGKALDWYAYPIFRPETLWSAVFPQKPYAYVPAVFLLFCEMMLLALGFFLCAYVMTSLQNIRYTRRFSKYPYVSERAEIVE